MQPIINKSFVCYMMSYTYLDPAFEIKQSPLVLSILTKAVSVKLKRLTQIIRLTKNLVRSVRESIYF